MRKTLGILLLTGATLLTGCGNSFDEIVVDDVNARIRGISAPVCVDDAYTTNQNTALTVSAANGVLTNDTPNGATLTFPTTTTQNGTVAGLANGGFTYTPANGFTGTDTFDYTLGNSAGAVTCTVTIIVSPINGFFVDAVNGDDGTGSFNGGLPFATIQAAVTTAGTNQDIIVRPGNYTGAVNLLDGQRLLGSGSTLANLQGAVRPSLTGPINMADGNTIDFVRVDGTNGNAIDAQDRVDGTVTNCEIANLTNLGVGINAISSSGTWNASSNSLSNLAGFGIRFTTDSVTNDDNLVVTVTNNTVAGGNFGAIGFTCGGISTVNARVTGNSMSNTTNPGGTFDVVIGASADFCADIENNTNDDVYQFGRNTTTSRLRVEEFGQLISVNNNSGTVSVVGGSEPVESAADGDCFPPAP